MRWLWFSTERDVGKMITPLLHHFRPPSLNFAVTQCLLLQGFPRQKSLCKVEESGQHGAKHELSRDKTI